MGYIQSSGRGPFPRRTRAREAVVDPHVNRAREDAVDELVLAALDALETCGQTGVEELCSAHPRYADALRARLDALAAAGLLDSPDAHPRRLGPYRIVDRLGGGGMGVVYAAVQDGFEREVALKVVRADQLYFPGARERFWREVRLVSRLAHAAIVHVYGVGEEDGVPFLAMERLHGATLAETLAQLDGPPRAGHEFADAVARVVEAREGERPEVGGRLFEGSGADAALRIARLVAEALAHAHARGVLHRDVKPSNVMLTTDGRALLFDFGLASAAGDSRLTRSGSRVGSLAYMPPEQARGDVADDRSDVYGAGALLCETLTLRPPYEGSPEAVTGALLRGDKPVPLRGVRLPRDVITILETALAHDPTHRYAGAAELARDLRNVLERRPVEARPAGRVVRLVRWVQRHPARAAALLLAVALPLALALQQTLARRATRTLLDSEAAANAEMRLQSERAEANLEHALKAIDVFVWQLGQDAFLSVPYADAELVHALRGARESLERIIVQRPDDAHLRCRLLRVLTTLAGIHRRDGDLDAADALYRESLAVVDGHDVHPYELLAVRNGLGLLQEARGEWEPARASFESALADSADFASDGVPGESHSQVLCRLEVLARNLVRVLTRLGDVGAARATSTRSVALAERALELAVGDAERLEARVHLGSALGTRAAVSQPRVSLPTLVASDDPGERAAFDRGLELLLDLAAEHPSRADVLRQASTLAAYALTHRPAAEAEQILRRGLVLAERLVRNHPERLDGRGTMVHLLSNLARSLMIQRRLDEAYAEYSRAAELAQENLDRAPDDLGRLQVAGMSLVNLSSILIDLGRRAEAADPAARGGDHLREALGRTRGGRRPLLSALAYAQLHEGYGRLARRETARVLELCAAMPEAALEHDPVLVVGTAELHAGMTSLSDDPVFAATQRDQALTLLETGVAQGFGLAAYLRAAPEWDALRADPRFGAVLERIEQRSD